MTFRKTTTILGAALAFAACGNPAEDGRNPSGSQSMVTSQDYKALYVASPDDGTVSRVDAASLDLETLKIDGEPTRVARIADRVLVTLRSERAVAELVDDGTKLTEVRRIQVGAEPVGIVATEDGTRVYVAVSQTGRILELDGTTLEELRAWYSPNEPRWLAIHPGGGMLYAAGMGIDGLVTIDLESGASSLVSWPHQPGFDFETGIDFDMIPRATGDLAASPTGDHIAIPMLYVDNTTPIVEADPESGEPAPPEDTGGYGGGRLNPVVVVMPTDGDGKPSVEDAEVLLLTDVFAEGGLSYPASVTFSPNGEYIFATIEGSGQTQVITTENPDSDEPFIVQAPGGFAIRTVAALTTPAGPRSIAFTSDDRGYVFGFLDRRITAFDLGSLFESFDLPMATGHSNVMESNPIAASTLPLEVEEGRRLFYSANNPMVSGGGVSCATCHFDGRTDGITWRFERGLRQTPSLAGKVSLREPVRWEADRATVAEDAMSTSQGLMGGTGMTLVEAERLAAFVDYTRDVDLPLHGETNAQIELGREVFNRAEVGCATCHSGALYTDKKTYDMFGFNGVKTPSLLGVAATAPYFHDGSAPNLATVLVSARTGQMGDTSSLNDEEMAALEVFLKSL